MKQTLVLSKPKTNATNPVTTHKMKKILIIILILLSGNLLAQNLSGDSINKKIKLHFEIYKPELFRYGGLTSYGESKTNFSNEQIIQELSLYSLVKQTDLVNNPTNLVFALCHNIIIHTPETGKELLQLLNKPTENKETVGSLFTEFILTGEFGEKLALNNLQSNNENWKLIWSRYLNAYAIYNSSIPQIETEIIRAANIEVKLNLIGSLMYIGNPKSIQFVKQIIDTTKSDAIQTKGIFVYAELTGYNGIEVLKKISTVGEKSKEELKSSISWLTQNTNIKNIYGTEITNDIDFINRFGDINSPTIIWLDKKGLLNDNKAKNPKPFSIIDKDTFINLLVESKVFGIEAAKANLFLSLDKVDLEKLLKLRELCFYSPNDFTKGRMKTLGIMIRYLNKK